MFFFGLPQILGVGAGWVIGHLVAYLLIGIAILRTRVIPQWTGGLLIVAVPVMGPVAYGSNIGAFQVLGYVLVLVVSVPAATAFVRTFASPSTTAP